MRPANSVLRPCLATATSLFLLASCLPRQVLSLPNTDIVYDRGDPDRGELGFIDADGSNLEIRNSEAELKVPVWKGDTIYGQTWSGIGGRGGRLSSWRDGMLSKCPGPGWSVVTYIDGMNAVTTTVDEGEYAIVRVNVATCQLLDTLVQVRDSQTQKVFGGSLSPDQQRLVYSEVSDYQLMNPDFAVMVMDIASGASRRIASGTNATWSPDGKWIAYTHLGGIGIVSPDGTETHDLLAYTYAPYEEDAVVFIDWSPIPRWSPDSRWLVYHRCTKSQCSTTMDYDIFKLDITNSDETLVAHGGAFPYWRSR